MKQSLAYRNPCHNKCVTLLKTPCDSPLFCCTFYLLGCLPLKCCESVMHPQATQRCLLRTLSNNICMCSRETDLLLLTLLLLSAATQSTKVNLPRFSSSHCPWERCAWDHRAPLPVWIGGPVLRLDQRQLRLTVWLVSFLPFLVRNPVYVKELISLGSPF